MTWNRYHRYQGKMDIKQLKSKYIEIVNTI